MTVGPEALGRLLVRENTVSDLLAVLVELDERPIVELLALGPEPVRAHRELSMGKGRLDLVLRVHDDRPVAVLEIKGAADLHGDQLDRYDAWADSFDPAPRRFLCTMDGARSAPSPWVCLSLVDLFGAWADSSRHDHARWLAGEIRTVLALWDREADGRVGLASGRSVPDLFTRRVAESLCRSPGSAGAWAVALRTNGGTPMFLYRAPHPGAGPGTRIAVDVRCAGRGRPGALWQFRPCVEVVQGANRDLRAARVLAHDAMSRLAGRMTGTRVRQALTAAGLDAAAGALRVTGRHDGFAHALDRLPDADVREQIADGRRSHHPAFRHDNGTRLASQFGLDLRQIDRRQVEDVCRATVAYLVGEAERDG